MGRRSAVPFYPYLIFLDFSKLFVADAFMKKKSPKFSFTTSRSTFWGSLKSPMHIKLVNILNILTLCGTTTTLDMFCCSRGVYIVHFNHPLLPHPGNPFFPRLGFTVCPRSSDPFSVVSHYLKWITTSWT